jgi:hypothetical protein
LQRAGALLCFLTIVPGTALQSQRVLGALDDATVAPRGTFRVSAGISFSRADDRFASGLPGRTPRGEREPLGAGLTFDALDGSAFEALGPLNAPLRSLSGQSAVNASLGALAVTMQQDVRTIPFRVDAGLTSRITVGALLPFVFVRNDVVANPLGGGNVGLNPALSLAVARTANGAALSQLTAATARLRGLLAACAADPSAPGCAPINANRPAAETFLAQSEAAATDLKTIYGDATAAGSRFAPVAGSALESAIFARLTAFNTLFQSFFSLPADSVLLAARPVGASRLSSGDLNTLLSDPAFGISAAPLESVEHGHLGDIEFGVKVLLFDGFGTRPTERLARARGVRARLAVGAAYRMGNGMLAAANNFVDLGTGDGAPDLEGRGYLDLILGSRLWWSAVVRVGLPREAEMLARVAPPESSAFPPAFREQLVTFTPGRYFEAEWSPRLILNDFFGLAGTYRYRRSDPTEYRGSFSSTDERGNAVTLDAATLGAFSGSEEHRAGLALTYSTVAAYAERRSGIPLELTLTYTRAVRGGNVPDASAATITARWYHKVFGANQLRR